MANANQNDLNQIFQATLGRMPTEQEIQFLTPYITANQITPYQIGQYLQSTPEALQARLPQQQAGLQNQLTQYNKQILGQATDAANATFTQNGRQFSSGQGNAVLQAGQQLAAQQAPMLANYYAQGQSGLNDLYGNIGQGQLQRTYNLQDSQTAYNRGIGEYYRQQNDYNDRFNRANSLMRMTGREGLQIGLDFAGGAMGAAGQAGSVGKLFSI